MIKNQNALGSKNPKQLPIVLVHGFWNTHAYLSCLSKGLHKKGWKVLDDLDLVPNNGKVGIEVLAAQLGEYVRMNIREGQSFELVGFSMGGLVARYYVQYLLDNKAQVHSLVTIATPNHGTYRAYPFTRIACIEMRPQSKFLQKLNEDISSLEGIRCTSIWAKYDTIIVPNKSGRLSVGREVILPFGIHALLPFSKRVLEEVEKALVN